MREIILILNHTPIPWARPGQRGHIRYDTQKDIKNAIRAKMAQQLGKHTPLVGPVALEAIFTVSNAKIKRPQYYAGRPDIDNYLKFYLDLCTGYCYADDCQVVELSAKKLCGLVSVVQLTFRELGDGKSN